MQRSTPRYQEIAAALRRQITDGALTPGQQVPPERDLSARYSASRGTVKRALRLLADEGLLVTGQGRGTFVREARAATTINWTTIESRARHASENPGMDQWSSAIIADGREPSQKISVAIVKPPPRVAERLGLGADETGVLRHRVRWVDGVPNHIADSYFRIEIAQGTPLIRPDDASAPGGILASVGLVQVRYHDEITVRMPTRAEADLLQLVVGTPVAEHMRTGYDADDVALRVMVMIMPGDRHVIAYDVPAT